MKPEITIKSLQDKVRQIHQSGLRAPGSGVGAPDPHPRLGLFPLAILLSEPFLGETSPPDGPCSS